MMCHTFQIEFLSIVTEKQREENKVIESIFRLEMITACANGNSKCIVSTAQNVVESTTPQTYTRL